MMSRTELCAWLRANSSGAYRPAAEAADEIEHLAAVKHQHFMQAIENGNKVNELRAALAGVMRSEVGRQTMQKLMNGQGSSTEDGVAWIVAASLMTPPPDTPRAAGA